MGIKSGTLTESCQEFYTETLFRRDKLRPQFKNYCDSLIHEGELPKESVEINGVGRFNGGWKFWSDLYSHEQENNFQFQPQFCIPDDKVKLPSWIINRYDIADYKISPRILYYPFGYFVVRVRIYFEFDEEKSVSEFLNFERSIQEEIKISSSGNTRNIQTIFKDINDFVFGDNVPEPYVGKTDDRKVCTVTYLYEHDNLTKRERARIIRRESRSVPDRIAEEVSNPYIGYLEGDQISIDSEGAVVVTPTFDTLSERNRRWKRLHLLNNLYIAYDFALLERNHIKRIRDNLSRLLDDFNIGKWFGNPIEPRYLVMLDSLLDFGVHLRVTRGVVYKELEPIEMKETVQPDIDDSIERVLNHRSYARSVLGIVPNILKGLKWG